MARDEISENTKVRLGIIVSCVLAICGASVTVTMIYAEHKDLPKKFEAMNIKVSSLEEKYREQCYFNKNLQNHLLKPNERYEIDCSK